MKFPVDSAGGLILPELRRYLGRSQNAMACEMAVSQPQIARYERQQNPRIVALQRYIEALGGSLRLIADIDGEQFRRNINHGLPCGASASSTTCTEGQHE